MHPLTPFPKLFLLNLQRRPDRLAIALAELARVGLEAEVVPCVDARDGAHPLDALYHKPGSRASAQTVLGIIARARAENLPGFIMLEDDVVFAADFAERLAACDVPADMEGLYFGAQHIQSPEPVSAGVVRATCAYDTHALGITAALYDPLEEVMLREYPWKVAKDVRFSFLHQTRRFYALLPNLAWQRVAASDIQPNTKAYSNYNEKGEQRWHREKVAEICPAAATPATRISFCMTSRDRAHHVSATLPAALAYLRPGDEVVLLDYGSRDGLGEWVRANFSRAIASGALVFASMIEAPPRFHPSHAKNVAHRLASGTVLCNLDADNLVSAGFLEWLRGTFEKCPASVTGCESWMIGGGWGRVATPRATFEQIRGYDERMTSWGFEDSDFARRAHAVGMAHQNTPRHHLLWISHGDEQRATSPAGKKAGDAENKALSDAAICAGDFAANAGKPWGSAAVLVNFTTTRAL